MKTWMQARPGIVVRIDNEPYMILKQERSQAPRGATNIKARIKNLITGRTFDRTITGDDNMDDIILERSKSEFLYSTGDTYYFMDQSNYEQIEMSAEDVGDVRHYLTEGLIVDLQYYEGKIIGVLVPLTVKLRIVECEPGVKGNTADGRVTKTAKLETGLEIKVPGFVESDEEIIVNTETGEYQERAKK